MPIAYPPAPRADRALFLDLDGTLLDIAPRPDAVVVPADLAKELAAASVALGGALAIVSGRMLSEVDALLAPLRLPGAGEHGAIIRLPDGSLDEIDAKVPAAWAVALAEIAAKHRNVLVEKKTHSVVVHFRMADRLEALLHRSCRELIGPRFDEFDVLQARKAFEIKPRTMTKGRAVARLMSLPPFAGRVPVFVGDDVIDQDGFAAVRRLGGEALDVFQQFAGRPFEVRQWIKSIAEVGS
jgi:trehalose 6-phosphate phosphatase